MFVRQHQRQQPAQRVPNHNRMNLVRHHISVKLLHNRSQQRPTRIGSRRASCKPIHLHQVQPVIRRKQLRLRHPKLHAKLDNPGTSNTSGLPGVPSSTTLNRVGTKPIFAPQRHPHEPAR